MISRFDSYSDNGELILAAHQLGHVRGLVLDATYGKGTWWSCAEALTAVTGVVAMDLHPHKATRAHLSHGLPAVCADFRRPPFRPGTIPTVFYDPRYKLNGTPTPDVDGPDERYGADARKPWREVFTELLDGLGMERVPCRPCAGRRGVACSMCHGLGSLPVGGLAHLLAPDGRLLMKCQDQVSSQAMRWQTFEAYKRAEIAGLELVDLLEFKVTPRPQPGNRRVMHAASNYSTLMIFGKPPIRREPLA